MMRYHRRYVDPRNQYRRWIDPRLRTLQLKDITAYLKHHGWTAVPTDRPGFVVFQEPPGEAGDGEPYVQFVPESEAGADYPLRLFELLTGLAEFEDRQAADIIDEILQQASLEPTNGGLQDGRRETETVP